MEETNKQEGVKNPNDVLYSVEDVQKIVAQATRSAEEQLKEAYSRLRQAELGNLFTRLNFLIKIVEIGEKHFDAEFITSCVEEIKLTMFPTEEEETQEGK